MEHILLVEPEYNNKYPPIGLMKISTYHKNKGDYVEFYKGKAPYNLIQKVDKVYITSLFTFYFEITVETIRHYMKYVSNEKIYFGGISATLMADRYIKETGIQNILKGQLFTSKMMGYDDDINVDVLPLDYDILDDVEYDYGISDNFFAHATRGCPRKCQFCAVKTLEPVFCNTNNLIKQIEYVRTKFGDKRNIMMMDNNVIFSDKLQEICDDLNAAGFVINQPTYVPPNPAKLFFSKIERRDLTLNPTWHIVDKFISYLNKFINRIRNEDILNKITEILEQLRETDSKKQILINNKEFIIAVVEKYRIKKPLQRYVDFNQGLDARLLTEEKMRHLAKLPIKPFRLAYDELKSTDEYIAAFELAYKYGIRHFSNYMLYNFNDKPEELWQRMYNNIMLYMKYDDVAAFSFPMKYAPVDMIDRSYIGEHWNKKFLSAMNIILNVTKGVVAKEYDFFVRAYGHNKEEFIQILSMPNEFIKHRNFFEEHGFTEQWKHEFTLLNPEERAEFIELLSSDKFDDKYSKLFYFYKITRNKVEKNLI